MPDMYCAIHKYMPLSNHEDSQYDLNVIIYYQSFNFISSDSNLWETFYIWYVEKLMYLVVHVQESKIHSVTFAESSEWGTRKIDPTDILYCPESW